MGTISISMATRLDKITRKGSREAGRFGNQEGEDILFLFLLIFSLVKSEER